jgi:hypothetical protein
MVGQEQTIIAFMIGLVCCLGTGVSLLALGGFLLWRRSKADTGVSTPVRTSVPATDETEDTLVSERPTAAADATMDDEPSIVIEGQGALPDARVAPKPARPAARTIIAFDDDFDDDEEL